MKRLIYLLSILGIASTSLANNMQVSGLSVNQAAGTVTFTLSWDNSWKVVAAPNNWDAAWVFLKFKDCSAPVTTPFTHGTLSSTTSDHSFGTLEPMTTLSAAAGSTVMPAAMDDNVGVMLRRNTDGNGTITQNITLDITNLPAAAVTIAVKVYAIEMVYIPQSDFYIGDADGSGGNNFSAYSFMDASCSSGLPVLVTTVNETGSSNFIAANGTSCGSTYNLNGVPAAWPKGQYGYYLMKHEISQGMYAEFLSTIGTAAQGVRYLSNVGNSRNETYQVTGDTYTSSRPDRAQNYMGWADFTGFLDWSGLRPYTELEFEKACRGPLGSLMYEYAWGTTSITAAGTFAAPSIEDGTETFSGGNARYNNTFLSGGDGGSGPVRVGIFATSSSNRTAAGAGYYGNLELSGNLWEYVITMSSSGAANTFTRTHGDGIVNTTNGTHNVATWPISTYTMANATTNIAGIKGGAYSTGSNQLRTSDRSEVRNGSNNQNRFNTVGGRGAR